MDLDKPHAALAPAEQRQVLENLRRTKQYGSPRTVWVEDGHVYIEGHDGEIVVMTPNVAIEMARLLSEAGASALINRVIDDNSKPPA